VGTETDRAQNTVRVSVTFAAESVVAITIRDVQAIYPAALVGGLMRRS